MLELVEYDENACEFQGCNNPAVEYVLLRAGAVHVCKNHINEAKLEECLPETSKSSQMEMF
jgi:hypothetical protein